MLKMRNVWATRPLVERLTDNGIILIPMPTTPLQSVVAECHTPIIDNSQYVDASDSWQIMDTIAAASTQTDVAGNSNHCSAVGDVKKITKDALQQDMYIARNVVNPIAKAVAEDMAAYQKSRENAYANVLAVVPDIYEPLWDNPIFVDLIKAYDGAPAINDARIPRVHPSLSGKEIVELMKVGSSRFDEKDLLPWIADIGEDFVEEVWKRYLQFKTDEQNAGYTDSDRIVGNIGMNYPQGRKELIILFLLARRLCKDPIEGIQMDARQYEPLIDTLLQQTGRLLCRVVEDRVRNNKGQDIVKEHPYSSGAEYQTGWPEGAQIVVYMDLYTKWLDAGGSPEILYGAAVTDRERNGDILLQKADYYKQVWEIRAASIQSMVRDQLFTNSIVGLRQAVAKQINELDVDLIPERSTGPLHKRLDDVLKTISIHCLVDPFTCARDVVIRTIFPHTNARAVLDIMDSVAKDNPQLPMREVALITAVRLLAKWYVKQMQIQYKGQ